MEIEQARLLCLKAAWMMDQGDQRAAAPWISQIKVVAPRVALKVTDEAVQMFGAQGISQDTPLARSWTHLRTLRLADGPDAVHRRQVARTELREVYAGKDLIAPPGGTRAACSRWRCIPNRESFSDDTSRRHAGAGPEQ